MAAAAVAILASGRIVDSNQAIVNSLSNTRSTLLENEQALTRIQHQLHQLHQLQQSLAQQQASEQFNVSAARVAAVRQQSSANAPAASNEDAKYRDMILAEALDVKPAESWDDIAGLDGAKQVRHVMVCCEAPV